jgi:hypothetical protein
MRMFPREDAGSITNEEKSQNAGNKTHLFIVPKL